MHTTKAPITLETEVLERLERRLARECAKLDPALEVAIAEVGISAEGGDWPEY